MRGCSNVNEAKEICAIKLSWQSSTTQAAALQHLTLGYIYIKNKAEIFISNLWLKSFEEVPITHSQAEPSRGHKKMEDHLRSVARRTHGRPPHRAQHREWVTRSPPAAGCPPLTAAPTRLY